MRWDKLFDDLETQLERELTAEEIDLGAEEERLRVARLSLRDRLAAIGNDDDSGFAVTLTNGERLRLRPVTFGRDWLSADVVDESRRRTQCILPLAAVAAVAVSRRQVIASLAADGELGHPALSQRLGLAFVLRDLCRRRRAVELLVIGGVLHGTIDRVGRDHLDLAVHEPGSARRDSAVTEFRLVPFSGLLLVRLG
jgi:hypothetical protein